MMIESVLPDFSTKFAGKLALCYGYTEGIYAVDGRALATGLCP